MVPLAPRVPTIYYLPKVHKNPVQPPGRPIVTSLIGRYIDFYLQPLVRHMPSYLKETGATNCLLEGLEVQDDYIITTADVASLYTCIPQEKGIEAVHYFLEKEPGIASF